MYHETKKVSLSPKRLDTSGMPMKPRLQNVNIMRNRTLFSSSTLSSLQITGLRRISEPKKAATRMMFIMIR